MNRSQGLRKAPSRPLMILVGFFLCVGTVTASGDPDRFGYKLLATNRTSTMQKELTLEGENGFELAGMTVSRTTFGGAELVSILPRPVRKEVAPQQSVPFKAAIAANGAVYFPILRRRWAPGHLRWPTVMGKDQVARNVLFLLVFHEDQPVFRNWSVDFSLDAPREKEQPARDSPQSGAGSAGAAPGRGLQLPPEILADKYVSQAQRLLREKDHHGARQAMEKSLSFQQEHGLEPQPEDHFGYAKVWFALGEPERAIGSLVRYLQLRGRDADQYEEALDLLNRAEAEKARDEAAAYSAAQSGPPKIRAGETVVFDGMEFVGIPPGEFLMGSTGSYAELDEEPVTRVWISRGFFLGKYEVTQDQWKAVMGHNPSRFSGCGNCPVEKVSWNNVQAFIRKLNAQAEGGRYRLPTEAEWEYAARAGTTTHTYAGDFRVRFGFETPLLKGIAWYGVDSGKQTQPVGQKDPNTFGLHDMLGNVWEWVSDWYSRYPGGAVTDPVGPRTGRGRVARGGSWSDYSKENFRASYRRVFQPRHRGEELGFRLVRTE